MNINTGVRPRTSRTVNNDNFLQVEDIFNEPDESSTDDEKNHQDDLDDEENIPEDRLLTLETENNSQDR